MSSRDVTERCRIASHNLLSSHSLRKQQLAGSWGPCTSMAAAPTRYRYRPISTWDISPLEVASARALGTSQDVEAHPRATHADERQALRRRAREIDHVPAALLGRRRPAIDHPDHYGGTRLETRHANLRTKRQRGMRRDESAWIVALARRGATAGPTLRIESCPPFLGASPRIVDREWVGRRRGRRK